MLDRLLLTVSLGTLSAISLWAQPVAKKTARDQFKNPDYEYRPSFPFQGAAGAKYTETGTVENQLDNIYDNFGFGGIMVAPTDNKPFSGKANAEPGYMKHIGSGLQATNPASASPWLMTLHPGAKSYKEYLSPVSTAITPPAPLPAYLSRDYFDQLKTILAYSKERGRKVIFYDEVGYPSGIANYTTPEKFNRKLLEKTEDVIVGPQVYRKQLPTPGVLMAIVAMNSQSLQRIDLTPQVTNNTLVWNVPAGNWKVMVFTCVTAKRVGSELDYRAGTDYMDPEAVNWFVDKVYEPHAKEVGSYFGNTIIQTFFDDVGIFDEERTWTPKFNEKFKQRFGLNPATYYPALWESIGPETDAARIAFFDTRAELLADGFPKLVTDWGKRNNIAVSGHCPGNYDPQPVDMNGDPFKFYRAQPIPMVDVIFSYPTGRDGFKLVSDGADFYDKPIVAAETFNTFSPAGKTIGYRRVMELYVRGINRLMGSGLPQADVPEGPKTFAEWVGRHSMLLQGGRRVSDIAIFYPIADLEAFYRFDAPAYNKDMRWGSFVPYDNDFLAIGEMLLGEVHRDFTFLHPEFLLSDKITLKGPALALNNKVNSQTYKALILPGQRVISLKALQKIKAYYDQGGVVVATSQLPTTAAELVADSRDMTANNRQVQAIINEMFGIDPAKPLPDGVSAIRTNQKQGKAVFIRKPDGNLLATTLAKLNLATDVVFDGNPSPLSGGGMFSYIHKKKGKQDIYYFANSSDNVVETVAEVAGKIRPELWNPATGETTRIEQVDYLKKNGRDYTRFPLKLNAVTAMFVMAEN